MNVIAYLFFPSSELQYVLTTIGCAIVVLYLAKQRFDAVATEVDWIDFSKKTRVWTSRGRYLGALVLYCSLNLVFFRVLLQFGELLKLLAGKGLLGVSKEALDPFLQLSYITPPLAVLLILMLFDNKLSPIEPVERAIRGHLQTLGSIPRYVRQLIRRLKQAQIRPTADLADTARTWLAGAGASSFPEDAATLASDLARASYLQSVLESLRQDTPTDDVRAFLGSHKAALDEIWKKYSDAKDQVARFLHVAELLARGPRAGAPDLLLEEWRSISLARLGEDLKAILARQYLVLSCAILAGRQREAYVVLEEAGIYVSRRLYVDRNDNGSADASEPLRALRDDIALAAGLLVVVIYPAVLAFLWLALDWRPDKESGFTVGILWPVMLLVIMLGGLLPVFYALDPVARRGRSPIARFVNRHASVFSEDIPLFRCIVAGVASGVATAFALVALDYLHPHHTDPFQQRIAKLAPFGLVSLALSSALAIALSIRRERPAWLDALAIGAVTTGFGFAAFFIATDLFADVVHPTQ